jgi:glycosyltransferase involved in cell wall biosynthesis
VSNAIPVLHSIDTGGPGGAETVFATCASRVLVGRQQALAVVPYDGWLAGHLRELGLEPVFLPSRGALNLPYLTGLWRLARRHRARLIHSHLLGSNVYSAIVGRLLGIPVVAVFHGATDLQGGGRLAVLKRQLLSQRHVHLIAVAAGVQADLVRWGISPARVRVIYNGIDADRYSPGREFDLRRELGCGPDELLVGAVGNIRVAKAYDLLLRTAKLVTPTRAVRFAVVGEGSREALAPLLEMRAALGLENRVTFLGFRPTSPDLLRNFDIFLSSARSEGLPLSFLEAMAVGLPVVATPTSGAHELLDSGRTGLVAASIAPEPLADVLRAAIDGPELRARLGVAGRAMVLERFSVRAMTAAYDALYESLLTEHV